jgi:hypothetical protein
MSFESWKDQAPYPPETEMPPMTFFRNVHIVDENHDTDFDVEYAILYDVGDYSDCDCIDVIKVMKDGADVTGDKDWLFKELIAENILFSLKALNT